MKNKKTLIILLILIAVVGIWLQIAYADYCLVGINWKKPRFCILTNAAIQDGGSGTYIGLGYSFDIEGDFVTEDGYRGVERYTFKVLGINIKEDEIRHLPDYQ